MRLAAINSILPLTSVPSASVHALSSINDKTCGDGFTSNVVATPIDTYRSEGHHRAVRGTDQQVVPAGTRATIKYKNDRLRQ